MSAYAWFIAYVLLVVAAGFGLLVWGFVLDRRAKRQDDARQRENAKTRRHIAAVDPYAFDRHVRRGTFDALVADVTPSDYAGDQDHWSDYFAGRSETPTFDSVCADVARREAAELDVEWEREAGA